MSGQQSEQAAVSGGRGLELGGTESSSTSSTCSSAVRSSFSFHNQPTRFCLLEFSPTFHAVACGTSTDLASRCVRRDTVFGPSFRPRHPLASREVAVHGSKFPLLIFYIIILLYYFFSTIKRVILNRLLLRRARRYPFSADHSSFCSKSSLSQIRYVRKEERKKGN